MGLFELMLATEQAAADVEKEGVLRHTHGRGRHRLRVLHLAGGNFTDVCLRRM